MTIQEIISSFEENGITTTNKLNEAIYMLADGTLIDGGFDYGSRYEDHRCIGCLVDHLDRYDDNFWDYVHETFQVVRLVPETQYALILKGQKLTKQQISLLSISNYDIEEY